jgi:hypothetical protein
MIRRRGKKFIKGEVLSFVRTFHRASKSNRVPEKRMVKGIIRQLQRKSNLNKAFMRTWGRPLTPPEIKVLRETTKIEKRRKRDFFGEYSPEKEHITLKTLDPETLIHELTHQHELSRENNLKRLEYITGKNREKHRIESETYALLSETAMRTVLAERTGSVRPGLHLPKKKLSPKEKMLIKKEAIKISNFMNGAPIRNI